MKIDDKDEVMSVLEEIGIVDVKEEDIDKFNNILDIVTIGNDILRADNINVDIDDKTIEFVVSMVNSLYYWKGCGIAAPQVGKNVNIFAVKVAGIDENDEPYVDMPLTIFINPIILTYSEDTSWDYEGCLSVPGYDAMVERSNTIAIQYLDIFGVKHVEEYTDFFARAIQHEYDHLKGRIYTDIADMSTFTTRENLIENMEDESEQQ